jgi:hypothetical protein
MITVKNENMIIGATVNDLATPTTESGFVAKQNSKEIVDGDLPPRVILQCKIRNF